ncbi:MAG: class III extradiol ring-cleavage dioxygenase [Methylobacter sp.]|uniref:Class III extradiol ring-cleavage dioxygenase n=1 Tax=Candidatus Methylobacter titanis TaxID=3053457 RepID=A0AA43TQD1_9GAMM|nr:class III extradiol ring-cleavage dioxygenase [Candidatus Methylobacter titanis]
MKTDLIGELSPVLFIPHGAGPLPLLGDKGHQELIDFLKEIVPSLGTPSAILVISAHWEADKATITSGSHPSLLYDYYGFPVEAYEIEYPALGDPVLAEKIFHLLQQSGIEARLDDQRGFDHGLYVPLKIMFPDATVPCVQLSLINDLEPEAHIKLGKALFDSYIQLISAIAENRT